MESIIPVSAAEVLSAAFVTAQQRFDSVQLTGMNVDFSHFATLADIIRATRPALNYAGFYLSFDVVQGDGKVTAVAVLTYKGGDTLSGPNITVDIKDSLACAITEAERISLSSLLGIAAVEEDK